MKLEQLIKQKVGDKKYPILKRIKLGRGLMFIVALPFGTLILLPLASVMMIPIKPSLWATDKLRYLKESWSLRCL